jgi:hypothetical protein
MAMDGYNLGAGLIGGLQQGLSSYISAQDKQKDRKMQLATQGLIDDGKGGYMPDPSFQKKKIQDIINEGAQKGEILEEDPNNPGRAVFKGYSPEYISGQAKIKSAGNDDLINQLKAQQLIGEISKQKSDAADKTEKNNKSQQAATDQASFLSQELGRALDFSEKNPNATGQVMGRLSHVPGTSASQLNNTLDTIKANIAIGKLQEMRANSPTGGALGSVSNQDMDLLKATAGKLDTNLPTADFQDNAKRLINQYNDVVHGKGNGPTRYQLSFDDEGKPVAKGLLGQGSPSGLINPSPKAQEVERQTKDGKTAIFDANTKQFLRYK